MEAMAALERMTVQHGDVEVERVLQSNYGAERAGWWSLWRPRGKPVSEGDPSQHSVPDGFRRAKTTLGVLPETIIKAGVPTSGRMYVLAEANYVL